MKQQRILKFPLARLDQTTSTEEIILMPENARILSLQTQDNRPVIWAEVESEDKTEKRVFKTFETGENIKPVEGKRLKYTGTYQYQIGRNSYVGHVYEEVEY